MIPRKYRGIGEGSIASYDYTDLASGLGFKTYYATNYEDGAGGTTRALTESLLYSVNIEGSFTTTTFSYDLTPFNIPRTVKGTAIIRYSTHWSGTSSQTKYETFTLKKVSGAVITSIGTARSNTETSAGSAIIKNHVLYISLTETNFKKGDILRLELDPTNPEPATIYIGEDPANRDGTYITPSATYPTKFNVYIPFKLDL